MEEHMRWTETGCELKAELEDAEKRARLSWMGRTLKYCEEIDSTNTEAKHLAAAGADHGAVVVANRQTAGKGRRGRMWESPADSGIFMTFLLRPKVDVQKVSMLTLVAALAVSKAVGEETGCLCQIKWPNDLVMDGKKICGILTEMGTSGDQIQYAVVGIGINVGQQEFPDELKNKATSLCIQTKKAVSRASLIEKVLESFERYYDDWEMHRDMRLLREEYEGQLVNLGREVLVLAPEGEYPGVAAGISDTGELLVQIADGSMKKILSGEVSVRGVYGYV